MRVSGFRDTEFRVRGFRVPEIRGSGFSRLGVSTFGASCSGFQGLGFCGTRFSRFVVSRTGFRVRGFDFAIFKVRGYGYMVSRSGNSCSGFHGSGSWFLVWGFDIPVFVLRIFEDQGDGYGVSRFVVSQIVVSSFELSGSGFRSGLGVLRYGVSGSGFSSSGDSRFRVFEVRGINVRGFMFRLSGFGVLRY